MVAAVEALVAIGTRRDRRTVAVLGVMLELGDGSAEAHREVGRLAAAAGVDVLVTVGEPAREIAAGFASVRPAAADDGTVLATAGRTEALAWVRENVAAEDVVLVKASRGAALEKIADGLLEEGEVPTR
jgi:UDP-N-acetylmuramoyl-tripeptide--D-alanyl-D-alanine ligase